MKLLVIACLVTLCGWMGSAQAEEIFQDVEVGLKGYNRFTFGSPFVNIILPPDAPILGSPVKLADKQTIMFEIYSDAREPFQMIAYLLNGDIVTLNLTPNPDAPTATWRGHSFAKAPPEARVPIQRPEDAWLKTTFEAIVVGKIPEGFVRVKPPKSGRAGPMKAQYLAAFKNESYILLVARLMSHKPAMIQPQDLYVPGVKAVVIDGDRVGGPDAPVAYILMAGR